MKALSTVTLFIIIFTLCSSKANAGNTTFKAGDNTFATKLCVAAVSNDLQKTKRYIQALSREIYGSMYHKANFISGNLLCNDTDLVKFTAQYHAEDTFEYFNKRAMKKYRLTDDEIKIIDIVKVNDAPQVIVVTSR